MEDTPRLVISVEFFGTEYNEPTPSVKFPLPEWVRVLWSDGSHDDGPFYLAGSGDFRDVLASSETDYVLKVQDSTREMPVVWGQGEMSLYVPAVNGVQEVSFHGLSLSVLVEERIPYTMDTIVDRLLAEEPSRGLLDLLTRLCAGFFSLVVSTAVDMEVRLSKDLHWCNIGVTMAQPTVSVVYLEFEGYREQSASTAKGRCTVAVATWLEGFTGQINKVPESNPWHICLLLLHQRVSSWWSGVRCDLPERIDIDAMREKVFEFLCTAVRVERAVVSRPSSSTACVVEHAVAEALPQPKKRKTLPTTPSVKTSTNNRLAIEKEKENIPTTLPDSPVDLMRDVFLTLGLLPHHSRIHLPRRGLWKNLEFKKAKGYANSLPLQERLRLADGLAPKMAWHDNHGAPRHESELYEDCCFLMRCLHKELPLDRVLVPTKTSKTEVGFVRRYGVKFCDVVKKNATITSSGRLATARVLPVLQIWLLEMSRNGRDGDFGPVPDWKRRPSLNRFDWDGWFLNDRTELETLTTLAIQRCTRGLGGF